MHCRGRTVLCAVLMFTAQACAQLPQVNPEKLPQDQGVQKAYLEIRLVEPMAHNWNPSWTYDTPKDRVVALLTSSLSVLQSAETAASENEELLLLTGLVAHLAYNVDVEKTYEVAVQSFEKASKLTPADYRPEWFLAMHRCQSNESRIGMEQMLAIEDRLPWQQLPVDFWDDYINCSTIALMPAHTLRALDHATHLGKNSSEYAAAIDIAHKRYKPTDATSTYPAREAWQATEGEGHVQFTSQLCGVSFSAHGDWHTDIRDVAKGTCVSTLETGPYPGKSGNSSPTLLLLTRPAKSDESLDDFAQSFVKRYSSARPTKVSSCPSTKCVALEILTNAVYPSEGGGHFLVVAFADPPPDFPGLLFETPIAPPKAGAGDKVAYYHPDVRLQRLDGTLYTLVELDSNESIFDKAAADFRYLLSSIRID